jgi:hypothetical protein
LFFTETTQQRQLKQFSLFLPWRLVFFGEHSSYFSSEFDVIFRSRGSGRGGLCVLKDG